MKIIELVNALQLTIFSGESGLDREITGGYVSDLLSDVMGNAKEGQVWITLQNHKNVMAIASLKELAAVIVIRGNKPDEATMDQSNEEGIPMLGTQENTFIIAGKIYQLLHKEAGR